MQPETLADRIARIRDLTILASLVAANRWDTILRDPGLYTLFAPTDQAFMQLPAGSRAYLQSDPPRFARMLRDHLIPQRLVAADLMGLTTITTVSERVLTLAHTHGLQVEQRYLVAADALATNGVLHTIDRVLLFGHAGP